MGCLFVRLCVPLAILATAACGGDGDSIGVQPSSLRSSGVPSFTVRSGLPVLNEQPWDQLIGGGWNYLRRTSSLGADVVADNNAAFSPPHNLRIAFTPDMPRDTTPTVHWVSLPEIREAYTEWWFKLSSNWTTSTIGASKMTFLWPREGEGQVYSHIGGMGPPHRININTEWAPYGQRFWEPNLTATPIVYDTWYHIEWYAKWASAPGRADGVMQWWVNSVPNGDYRNVMFPSGCCFIQFEFAPTRQFPPQDVQYMYIDHASVRGR
jgi:hypothetical protein